MTSNPETPGLAPLSSGRRAFFWLVLPVLVCGGLQLAGWILFHFFPRYEVVRQTLMGNTRREVLAARNVVGQAFLLYIPAPGMIGSGMEQHNMQGYRGPAVPLRRTPGKLRILFLGGSTTYGWLVRSPDQTYPAHAGRLLEERLPPGVTGVEVVNAGMVWGSSAEILTHYLFKFRYYAPDVVVINTGGNDGQAAIMPRYQPDYSHWRKPLPIIEPWDSGVRWLLHFRPLAFAAVRLLHMDLVTGRHFASRGTPPPAYWYSEDARLTGAAVPDEDLGFKNNLRTAIRESRADGAEVLLVPFRANPEHTYQANLVEQFDRNERILHQLAVELDIGVAPFPASVISPENWADDRCHLNGEGSREKAQHVVEYLLPMLQGLAADSLLSPGSG